MIGLRGVRATGTRKCGLGARLWVWVGMRARVGGGACGGIVLPLGPGLPHACVCMQHRGVGVGSDPPVRPPSPRCSCCLHWHCGPDSPTRSRPPSFITPGKRGQLPELLGLRHAACGAPQRRSCDTVCGGCAFPLGYMRDVVCAGVKYAVRPSCFLLHACTPWCLYLRTRLCFPTECCWPSGPRSGRSCSACTPPRSAFWQKVLPRPAGTGTARMLAKLAL